MKNKKDRSGFTLAELLIVVAIIAVLTAVGIPVFNGQMEKSRETTDLANVRALYTALINAVISDEADELGAGAAVEPGRVVVQDGVYKAMLSPLKQKQEGWNGLKKEQLAIGNAPSGEWTGEPGPGGSCLIEYEPLTMKTTVIWSGGEEGSGTGGGNGSASGTGNAGTVANKATAMEIGEKVLQFMKEKDASNGTTVTITVDPSGEAAVSFTGHTPSFRESDILGLLGPISFDQSDTVFVNGYMIEVKKNNGNGGKITINPINTP